MACQIRNTQQKFLLSENYVLPHYIYDVRVHQHRGIRQKTMTNIVPETTMEITPIALAV